MKTKIISSIVLAFIAFLTSTGIDFHRSLLAQINDIVITIGSYLLVIGMGIIMDSETSKLLIWEKDTILPRKFSRTLKFSIGIIVIGGSMMILGLFST